MDVLGELRELTQVSLKESGYDITLAPASHSKDITITIPLSDHASADTLPLLATAQTFSGAQTFGAEITASLGINVASGQAYEINGTDVLTATSLGAAVVSSSLTTVGALNSGSITSGFGAINVGSSAITGGVITASTNFAGALTGNVTGNVSGTAATVTSATQASITTCTNLVTVGALDSGSITSGFTSIDVGAGTIDGGVITADTNFAGALTGNVTGNCSGSSGSCLGNAATVTTNANLTGDVTSVGNASTITALAWSKLAAGSTKNQILQTNVSTGIIEEMSDTPSAGEFLKFADPGYAWDTPSGAGDTISPATNTDTALAIWDGTDSKTLKDSVALLSTPGVLSGLTGISSSGTIGLDGAVTINTTEADKDFRIGALSITNALFLDGANGHVGMGIVPVDNKMLTIAGTNATNRIQLRNQAAAHAGAIEIVDEDGNAGWEFGSNMTVGLGYELNEAGVSRLYIEPAGAVIFNEPGNDRDFRIESAVATTGTHAFFLQGSDGFIGINEATPSARVDIGDAAQSNILLNVWDTHASYDGILARLVTTRAANSAFDYAKFYASGTGDPAFQFTGDGNGKADGSWTTGPADYAEMFEWEDSNPNNEDRRGCSVSLIGEKIKIAEEGETPIGIISGKPAVLCDAAWNNWTDKYLKDKFGAYILDENGDQILNSEYDEEVEYIPREQRKEWSPVGIMGKLKMLQGQVVGNNWVKMVDAIDGVEKWLVK